MHHERVWTRRVAVALALLLCGIHGAFAVDGVIEINQARALAGGISSVDSPGFPVSIIESGSYRLTGDLTMPDETTTGIAITASDVTLDLNGFALLGRVSCTPDACTPDGNGSGVIVIEGFGASNVTVRNGTVRGFGADGLSLSGDFGIRVERVRAIGNADRGIFVGATTRHGASVTECTAIQNGSHGIEGAEGSLIADNVSNANRGDGILARAGSTVRDNVVRKNAQAGISMAGNTLAAGNTVLDNTGLGLTSPSLFGYAGNVLAGNAGGCPNDQVQAGVEIGGNLCCSTTCP